MCDHLYRQAEADGEAEERMEAEARAEGIADCQAVVEGMLDEDPENLTLVSVLGRVLAGIEKMRRETRAPGPTLDEKRAE